MRYHSFEVAVNSGHAAAILHSMWQFLFSWRIDNHHTLAKSRFCSHGCGCWWSCSGCQGICKHSLRQIQVLYLQYSDVSVTCAIHWSRLIWVIWHMQCFQLVKSIDPYLPEYRVVTAWHFLKIMPLLTYFEKDLATLRKLRATKWSRVWNVFVRAVIQHMVQSETYFSEIRITIQ